MTRRPWRIVGFLALCLAAIALGSYLGPAAVIPAVLGYACGYYDHHHLTHHHP